MAHEIERKFLLHSLPKDIDPSSKIVYERHFLEINPEREVRIQRKGDVFYQEIKSTRNTLTSDKQAVPITPEEFNNLKQRSIGSVERDGYPLPGIQNATVKVYHGQFEGLIRAEVEFPDTDSATRFTPPDWFGPEITDSDLGRDSRLLQLSNTAFRILLKEIGPISPATQTTHR